MHLVSSHSNDVGLTALHLEPLPRGPARHGVAETFYLVDLADSKLAAELKEAGKAVVYQVCSSVSANTQNAVQYVPPSLRCAGNIFFGMFYSSCLARSDFAAAAPVDGGVRFLWCRAVLQQLHDSPFCGSMAVLIVDARRAVDILNTTVLYLVVTFCSRSSIGASNEVAHIVFFCREYYFVS